MSKGKASFQDIEQRKPSQSFYLGDMGKIFDKAGGKADVPHRHDYYTVLFIDHAQGDHIIDYQGYSFEKKEVHFVSPGQVHQVLAKSRPEGWVFTFSRDFLAENNIPESFITNINLFKPFGDAPPLQLDDETFDRLMRIVQEMESCMPLELTYRHRALGALLQLFLIYTSNSTMMDSVQLDEDNAGVCILRDFKKMVEHKFRDWHKVSQYADKVHISAKHLSATVKQITGKSAKEIILDRLVLESKRLLLHTELSMKEIAYQIGFEEPLHFSGFFKKHVGIAPSKFRTDKRK